MKKVWKRINGKVKIAVLICCTLIGGYGILKAPASDQSEMEQELKNREQELMQKESQTTAPNPSTSPETDMQKIQANGSMEFCITLTATDTGSQMFPRNIRTVHIIWKYRERMVS